MPGHDGDAEGDRHDYRAMSQGKQCAAIAGQSGSMARVVAGQAVDGRQVIGIEAMLQAEHEGQDEQR